MVLYSIIITTYNRAGSICDAIDSGLKWIDQEPYGEIIVIDDASTDETFAMLHSRYAHVLMSDLLRIMRTDKNCGTTAAKNVAAAAATGDWLVFLDSDDQLYADAVSAVVKNLTSAPPTPLVFFRAYSLAKNKVSGQHLKLPMQLDLVAYLTGQTKEDWLVVVRRRAFNVSPFDGDLRGFEGLAYARHIRQCGPALLTDVVALRIDDRGPDRLSVGRMFHERALLLARGHFRMLHEFAAVLGWRGWIRQLTKILFYLTRGTVYETCHAFHTLRIKDKVQ